MLYFINQSYETRLLVCFVAGFVVWPCALGRIIKTWSEGFHRVQWD